MKHEFKGTHSGLYDDDVIDEVIEIGCNYETIYEVVEVFKRYLLACGYHPDLIDKVLGGDIE